MKKGLLQNHEFLQQPFQLQIAQYLRCRPTTLP